jgi:hypothetical protein
MKLIPYFCRYVRQPGLFKRCAGSECNSYQYSFLSPTPFLITWLKTSIRSFQHYSSLKGFGNRMQWEWQLEKQYHGKTTGTSASVQQIQARTPPEALLKLHSHLATHYHSFTKRNSLQNLGKCSQFIVSTVTTIYTMRSKILSPLMLKQWWILNHCP